MESPSAARSTGSCSRAIWRAICGGTLGSDRIWSNRLPTTSITMWSSEPVAALAQLLAVGQDQVGASAAGCRRPNCASRRARCAPRRPGYRPRCCPASPGAGSGSSPRRRPGRSCAPLCRGHRAATAPAPCRARLPAPVLDSPPPLPVSRRPAPLSDASMPTRPAQRVVAGVGELAQLVARALHACAPTDPGALDAGGLHLGDDRAVQARPSRWPATRAICSAMTLRTGARSQIGVAGRDHGLADDFGAQRVARSPGRGRRAGCAAARSSARRVRAVPTRNRAASVSAKRRH